MPISFQTPDYIGPALQNLGETMSQIQQAKNAHKQQQIDNYMKLVDISLEGVRANHREELLGESDKFKKEAADIYAKAEERNEDPNYKELGSIEDKKKMLLTKVAQSQLLQESYQAAMKKAMDLQSKDKLDPESLDALNKWATSKDPIDNTVDPMALVQEQYTPSEVIKMEQSYFNSNRNRAKDNSSSWKWGPDGALHEIRGEYPPQKVAEDAANLWDTNPMLQKFYGRNNRSTYIQNKVDLESTKGVDFSKFPPTGGASAKTQGWSKVENGDGTTTFTPDKQLPPMDIKYEDGSIGKTTLVHFTQYPDGSRVWEGTKVINTSKDAVEEKRKNMGYPSKEEVDSGAKPKMYRDKNGKMTTDPKKSAHAGDVGYYETKSETIPVKIDENKHPEIREAYPKSPSTAKKVTPPPAAGGQYFVIPGKGKATEADLKAAGWSDEQISQLEKSN